MTLMAYVRSAPEAVVTMRRARWEKTSLRVKNGLFGANIFNLQGLNNVKVQCHDNIERCMLVSYEVLPKQIHNGSRTGFTFLGPSIKELRFFQMAPFL